MASDDDFMLYEVPQSAHALAACGRSDRHSHSDEADSSQKPYNGRDEYSEEHVFPLAGEERLHTKSSEGSHGNNKGLEGFVGRVFAFQSQNLMVGMNGGGTTTTTTTPLHRRTDRSDPEASKSLGSIGKKKDRDDSSDGGTYFNKKGKSSAGEGYKKDREEWSDGAISCLLDAYTEKYLQLNRGNLRGSDWEEVALIVSERANGPKPGKTVDQCKNKVDSLKKRYKTEKSRGAANGLSYWPWFKKVDQIVGSSPKLLVMSDEDKERANYADSVMKPTKRPQIAIPATLELVNVPKKSSSALRWRRVLLKVSGDALKVSGETFAGDHTQNVDPKVTMLIAREVASVARLGVEVAIVVGGGNFFNGSSWVGTGGLDRASADHIGMLATVMNSIFLQASLENVGIQTRVQTAFRMAEVAEPYIRRRAIQHLEKGRVVIFGAGTGNPYFSTDTAAALRAAEINAEVVVKATTVDGIFDSDPKLNPNAVLLEHLSYRQALEKTLNAIDVTAITLCQENGIPVVIFNMNEAGNIFRALSGERVGTLIDQTGGMY